MLLASKKRKKAVYIVTKTKWSEPPRIRHQIAYLLANNGHDVRFVEKNQFMGSTSIRQDNNIIVVSHGEILHHQLRINSAISAINDKYEAYQFKKIVDNLEDQEIIFINCNYDSQYLRGIKPDSKIITLIHDDYIAQARPWSRDNVMFQFRKTLDISNYVLAVSDVLLEQATALSSTPGDLLLPWARSKYNANPSLSNRNSVLFWGYIYDILDLSVFTFMASKGVKIHIVGPLLIKDRELAYLSSSEFIELHPPSSLADISDIVDRCCCAILPYNFDSDRYKQMLSAINISNKAFELLAHGLPLLYRSLPSLIDSPPGVIHKCESYDDYLKGYELCRENFLEYQTNIKSFLSFNTPEVRYNFLKDLMEKI